MTTNFSERPKKKKPSMQTVKFSDGTELVVSNQQAGGLSQKQSGINHIPKEKAATELPEKKYIITDDLDETMEYPPPRANPQFRRIWKEGIDSITSKKNFNTSHLSLFEVYCDLLVTLRALSEYISEHGQTFRISTLTGEVRRTHPEVTERNKTISQLANYSRLLGLMPKGDSAPKPDKEEKSEWE